MDMEDKFILELTQEEGVLLLTSARLLDKLVAGVTIHARDRDELIREIIDKLSGQVAPALSSMSDELADAIVDSVLGVDEQDDSEFDLSLVEADLIESQSDTQLCNYPMYAVDDTLPKLEKALIDHRSVKVKYYSFVRESVDAVTLNPLTILKEEGLWRMVAYCHERKEVLLFRIDRIKELMETSQRFEAPKDFASRRNARYTAYC
ncbi:MAG TPA: WYL domain-containing protein [Candidatus Obscuribacterales bacterium]